LRIKAVRLKHFRNYAYASLELDPKLNIIIGDNAQGKTNLLEAIYVSGFAKSFRTSKESDLVNFNEELAYVSVEIERDNGVIEKIEYRINQKSKKEFLVNGINITKISELLGAVNMILFYPDDLKLIKDSPIERRKFLNRELSHISRIYCSDIIDYNKILMQRNELLKKMQFHDNLEEMLDVWDEQLCDKGSRIIVKRLSFIEKLGHISNKIHKNITENKENLKIHYVTSIKNLENYDTIKGDLMVLLKKHREMDIRRGFTSIGPHRDDLDIMINDINIKSFGSQGQQRTAALSLKLSEIEIIKEEVGEYPILLLDDVMSELDIKRQRDLIYTLKDVQTIITTTDVTNLLDDYVTDSKVVSVMHGSLLNS
jgi:DNA replication and repair protein RecF